MATTVLRRPFHPHSLPCNLVARPLLALLRPLGLPEVLVPSLGAPFLPPFYPPHPYPPSHSGLLHVISFPSLTSATTSVLLRHPHRVLSAHLLRRCLLRTSSCLLFTLCHYDALPRTRSVSSVPVLELARTFSPSRGYQALGSCDLLLSDALVRLDLACCSSIPFPIYCREPMWRHSFSAGDLPRFIVQRL